MTLDRRLFLGGVAAASLAPMVRGTRAASGGSADAIIVGAGLAGLYAANLLQELGLSVIVLEGSARIGGRLLTVDQLDGQPEAGGQTLDAMYSRVLSIADRLGVATFERTPTHPGNAYYINGALLGAADWAEHPANRLAPAEKDILPNRLYAHYMGKTNPLPDLYAWTDPAYRGHDDMPIGSAMAAAGMSAEAGRLAERWFDGGGMDWMSALFAYRKQRVAEFGRAGAFRIVGGSNRLTEAMAGALAEPVRLSQPAIRLRSDATGAEVMTADGAIWRGRAVFCSIPFPVLRGLVIEPVLPPLQRRAVESLPYNQITQVKIAFDGPFWEEDGLPPALYADSFIERLTATPGQDRALHYLNAWIKGRQAAALDRHDEAEIGRRVVAELERIRPAATGRVRAAHVWSWGRNPWSRGAYHFMGTGQVQAFESTMRAAHGNIHFIGEHMAEFQQGMEGACESAEREVFAMLDRQD